MGVEDEDRIRRTEGPGAPPGTLTLMPGSVVPVMRVLGYGPEGCEEHTLADLSRLDELLGRHAVTWIDVDGVGDLELIRGLGRRFRIHPLVLEDVVHVHQRAKVESYKDLVYVVARMVNHEGSLETEQLSLVLAQGLVITFQEGVPGDCLEPVRRRIRHGTGRIRARGADWLTYALLDAVVDHYFPVVEAYADRLETLEDEILDGAGADVVPRIHAIKRELITLRRTVSPMREMVGSLRAGVGSFILAETETFMRDVRDHIDQLIDLIETYSELARSLVDLQLSLADHRMNEVMKVLTIVGSIFLPLTFVTGLYGMNFDRDGSPSNMPELGWSYGYEFALGLMAAMATGMLLWFWRKGWLD